MNRLHDHDFHPPLEKTAGAPIPIEDRPNSALAVVSLVFGILTWSALPLLGAIISVVSGHAALSQIREEGGRLGGRALAKAGMVMGYLQFALIAAFLVVLASYFRVGPWPIEDRPATPSPAVSPPSPFPEVKLADAMDRADFDLIDFHGMNKPGDEVIAFSRDPALDPQALELALLTTRRLVTLSGRRVSAVDLAAITGVEDHPAGPESGHKPYLAVFSGQDLRLRVPLASGPRGEIFRVALASARKVARDFGKGRTGTH